MECNISRISTHQHHLENGTGHLVQVQRSTECSHWRRQRGRGQPRGRGLPGREKIECRKSENSNHFTLDDNSEKADLSDID